MKQIVRHNIGDVVVALSNPSVGSQPRIKGNKYIVQDILYCPKCGMQCINIGEYCGGGGDIECHICLTTQPNHGKYWTDSSAFANIEDINKMLEEAVLKEDYELAITLRDL
jgi:hypothetical protein